MKYLKTYENYIDNMQVGDYVLLNMKQIKNGLDSFSADENWYELPDENTVALYVNYVSDNFCPWNKRSWTSNKKRSLVHCNGDCWWGSFPSIDGTCV